MDEAGIRGKTKAAKAAWDKAARSKTADLDAVMAAFADVGSPDALLRLALLPKDPRVDEGLVAVCEAAPYRATMTQPFWKGLFKRLASIRDPELVARLAAPALFEAVAPSMQAWLRKQRGALVEGLQQQKLVASAKPVKKKPAIRDLSALEAAVYASPDDDAPRAVYADALVEAGDPRGEFISLQLGGDPAVKLLAAHKRTFLGPLAPILNADVGFARGFLDACTVNPKKLDVVEKVVDHPMWSTVRALGGCARIALSPALRSLRELEFSCFEGRLHGVARAWHDLLVKTERPLTRLHYTPNGRVWSEEEDPAWGDADELLALRTCAALPALRDLTLVLEAEQVARFVDAPIAKRVNLHFVVRYQREATQLLIPSLRALAKLPKASLEIGPGMARTFTFEDGKGAMMLGSSNLAKTAHPLVCEEAIAVIAGVDIPWTVDAAKGFAGIASVRRAAERAPASPARRDTRR